MSSAEYRTVDGRITRVTRVDSCGDIVYAEDSQAVSKSFVSVQITPNTISKAEVNLTGADGQPGIYEPEEQRFINNSVEATFYKVDPEFFELITKQELVYDDDGVAIGFSVDSEVDVYLEAFALEVWAGDIANCTPGSGRKLGYTLHPFLKGARLGDHTIQAGAVTFTITGARSYPENGWGSGPYPVMTVGGDPALLTPPLGANQHERMIWVDQPAPEPFVGARPVLDPTNTAITAIVAEEGGSPSEADFTFTSSVSGEPVWIEFGDGQWDYIADGTDGAVHTYGANGVYTARASSNMLDWVEVVVTIPFP
jgi:hypothetical protein